MRYKYLLLLLALLALNTPISAEYFRHIGLSEGLTQPSVMSIHQDQLGRMWFGTREGINLYDGKQITAFKGWCNASNDSAPIWLGNEVSSIVEDKQGNIFFLVDDDIIKFDIQTEQFSRLSKGSRIPVLTSLEGDLWYMRHDSLFKHSSGVTVKSIFEDAKIVYYKAGAAQSIATVGADNYIAPLTGAADKRAGLALVFNGKEIAVAGTDMAIDGITLTTNDPSSATEVKVEYKNTEASKGTVVAPKGTAADKDAKGVSITDMKSGEKGTLVVTFTDKNGVVTTSTIDYQYN